MGKKDLEITYDHLIFGLLFTIKLISEKEPKYLFIKFFGLFKDLKSHPKYIQSKNSGILACFPVRKAIAAPVQNIEVLKFNFVIIYCPKGSCIPPPTFIIIQFGFFFFNIFIKLLSFILFIL